MSAPPAEHPAASPTLGSRLQSIRARLPHGQGLPLHTWRVRHRRIVLLLWLHIPALLAFAWFAGPAPLARETDLGGPLLHLAQEMGLLAALATAASWPRLNRRARSFAASIGLVSCSALLVHLSGGYIEAHFHFFVMVGIIALYHDWLPFLVSIAFVALHHGLAGTLDPASVYNHPGAIGDPWMWALVHAFFILGLSTAEIVHWRASERAIEETQSVLLSAGDGILGVKSDGRVAFANPAAAALTGRPMEQLVGAPVQEVLGAGAEAFAASDGRLGSMDGRTARGHDLVLVDATGSTRFVAWTTTPLGRGTRQDGVVMTLRDVTERNLAVQEMAAREKELRDAQRIAGLGSFASDPTTGQVTLSAHLRHMLGLPPGEGTLSGESLVLTVHPEDRDRVFMAVQRAKDGDDPIVEMDYRIVRPNGEIVHAHLRGEVQERHRPPEERPFVGTVQDMTERRLAEEARRVGDEQRREIEVLRERDAFKSRVLNAIAHELNTPLTPVKLQLHVLGSEAHGPLNDRQQRSVHLIGRNLTRFGRLVRDLLDAARLDGGQLRVAQEEVRLDALLNDAVETYAQPAHQADITLQVRPMPEAWVRGDAQRLGQVIDNLVSNAIKFTPRGGHVTLGGETDAEHVRVWVEDTGSGLSPEEIQRLFQPFSQIAGKARGVDEGTGLGLYVSRGIIERHNGTIGCTSAGPGAGSRFVFEVPRVAAPKAAAVSSPKTRTRSAGVP